MTAEGWAAHQLRLPPRWYTEVAKGSHGIEFPISGDATAKFLSPPSAEDAPDEWDSSWPPGGMVCSVCGTPTESEPCQEHQPFAYSRIT